MSRSAQEVLTYLPHELQEVLAGLDGAAPAIVDMTVDLLPFGSRTALETLKMAVGQDRDGRRELTLLPLAYEVMAASAARLSGESARVAAAEERAAAALEQLGLKLK